VEPGRQGDEGSCYTDGASRGNPGPSAAAYLLVDRQGAIVEERGWFLGTGTNNEAEYQAVIAGLLAAERHQYAVLSVYSDSELIIRQMQGRYQVRSPRLRPLHAMTREIIARFGTVRFSSVPRENPMILRADQLCNRVLDTI